MSLNELAKQINKTAREHGFWEADRNFGEMLALIHSEVSEALEEHRSGNPNVWYLHDKSCRLVEENPAINMFKSTWNEPTCSCIPKPEGTAVELADALIRILDTMHSLDVDIDKVVSHKMQYNDSRPYKHGRAY